MIKVRDAPPHKQGGNGPMDLQRQEQSQKVGINAHSTEQAPLGKVSLLVQTYRYTSKEDGLQV